jgi:hypothetical protein
MPRKPGESERDETPRTDLPPLKEPYYEGYFGTDEEEGVVREDEAGDEAPPADRAHAEESAGGDRGLL